jgi:hypothetical protein
MDYGLTGDMAEVSSVAAKNSNVHNIRSKCEIALLLSHEITGHSISGHYVRRRTAQVVLIRQGGGTTYIPLSFSDRTMHVTLPNARPALPRLQSPQVEGKSNGSRTTRPLRRSDKACWNG